MSYNLSNLLACKKYRETHKEKRKEILHNYYIKHKEKIKKYHRKHYLKNKEKISEYGKKYRELNKDKTSKRIKSWTLKNIKRIKEQRNNRKIQRSQQDKLRRKVDINFKLTHNLRVRILHALNGETKSTSTLKLIGCSLEELKKHLEKQFQPGMTWKNHTIDGWHIDHIKQCILFDLSKKSEQEKCFNYKNLRPLWAIDNLSRPKFKKKEK